jgi:transcriptional regulator with XRE-family HTH domain
VYALDGVASTLFHDDVSFGELLREKRQKRDLTQAELAQMIGVQQQAVGRWELDKDLPRQETIRLIAQQLDISGAQLAVALGYVDDDDADERDDPSSEIRLPAGVKLSDKQRRALDAILDAFLDEITPSPD